MPAGTLTLTNNSAVVKGTGTAFNTELKAGDFIVSVVGGVTYTLPVKTVDSATQATLIKAYDGPTQAGAAWYAVPRDAMNTITAQLAAETAKALRGLNLDKANWQQVFSGTGNITVTLPDGSSFTGPAWSSYGGQLEQLRTDVNTVAKTTDGKLGKSDNLSDLKDKETARNNLQLGKKDTVWHAAMELSSASPFIDFHYQNSEADYSVRLICDSADKLTCSHQFRARSYSCRSGVNGGYNSNQFNFFWNANSQLEAWVDATMVGSVAFNASDERIKKEIETASDNLAMAMRLRPVTFRYKNIGVWNDSTAQRGFIAQEVAEVVPEGAYGEVFPEDSDQETPTNPMGINILPLISVLTGAVQEQQKLITKLTERIDHQDELIKSLLEK
ncbi:hypothetical protein DMW53_09370 [Serratia marcescens]|uniref:tail fiber domain-containing protein n=1 Tax=Serratia marcescens TaxID=615 RepID=UPI000D88D123|nr:tail fiber domain-containing protein [Serratia marcescens]PYA61263.1 hypothetical protein DMW53_09370 [Serratia marcescens]PYB19930.1 hypothetical protein DMW55_07080 [Serratia marcescens]